MIMVITIIIIIIIIIIVILITIISLTSLLKLNFSDRMKTFRFSFFNRHRVLQKISQFFHSSTLNLI